MKEKKPILETLKEIWEHTICPFQRMWTWLLRFPERFSRSIKWGRKMFYEDWWDYSPIYSMLDDRLEEMAVGMIKYGTHTSRYSDARMMRLVRKYIHIVQERDFKLPMEIAFEEKYGKVIHEFVSNPARGTSGMSAATIKTGYKKGDKVIWDDTLAGKHIKALYHRIADFKEYSRLQYKKKLFYVLEKHIERWWD